jgi:hypothetical protein
LPTIKLTLPRLLIAIGSLALIGFALALPNLFDGGSASQAGKVVIGEQGELRLPSAKREDGREGRDPANETPQQDMRERTHRAGGARPDPAPQDAAARSPGQASPPVASAVSPVPSSGGAVGGGSAGGGAGGAGGGASGGGGGVSPAPEPAAPPPAATSIPDDDVEDDEDFDDVTDGDVDE